MTSRIKIQFFAMFREAVGRKEIMQDIYPETTLGDILNVLANKYDKDFKETVDGNTGQVGVNTLVMLNGRSIRDTNVKLKDKDLVIITIPAGGG